MFGRRLAWQDLPVDLRSWVAEVLGGQVVEATTQPGGFSPGTADRVVTAAGARAFVKAVSPAQNEQTPDLHRREAEVLRTLVGVPQVPQLLASHDDGHWVALVIEDVEGRHPLPWGHEELAASLGAVASVAGMTAPASWPRLEQELVGEMGAWSRLRAAGHLRPDGPGDVPWVVERLDEVVDLCARTLPRMAGDAVAHTDVRADNLLLRPDGVVRLVDWPWASRGAAWCDAAMLLVNVRWAGELDVRRHLGVLRDLGATEEDVLGLVLGLAGFFHEAARRPPARGLPTLRTFQREQGAAALRLARELWTP